MLSSNLMVLANKKTFSLFYSRTYYSNVDLTSSSPSSAFDANTLPRKPNYFNEPFNNIPSTNLSKTAINSNNHNPNDRCTNGGQSHRYANVIDNDSQYHATSNLDINNVGIDDKHYFSENIRSPILPPIRQNDNNR